MLDRRTLLGVGVGLLVLGCGGASSRLNTVKQPTGSGAIDFQVQNGTDVAVNNLYMAKTEAVDKLKKVEPGSPEEAELWGNDLLTKGALERGGRQKIAVEPGRWDVRAVDRDGRYQHVTGLKLGAGGTYILELGDGGWRLEK
jgi:hypothetical protein